MLYEPKAGTELEDQALVDPLEFLARVLIHIPEPHKHQVHFFGAYANRVRAIYRAEDTALPGSEGQPVEPTPRRALSKPSRELIYRIYEVDPLTCPRCGARMKILALIIEHDTIRRILSHLEKPSATRAPPGSTRFHYNLPHSLPRPRLSPTSSSIDPLPGFVLSRAPRSTLEAKASSELPLLLKRIGSCIRRPWEI